MLKKIINYIPGVAIPLIINFVLTMLYAAYLSPAEYGLLNIYLNTIQIVYSLTLSIFQTAALRFYTSKEYSTEEEYISSYIFANIFTTILCAIPCGILSLFVKFNWGIILLSVGTNGLFLFISNLHRVQFNSGRYNKMKVYAAGAALILLVLFSYIIRPLSFIWPLICVYGTYGFISIVEIFNLRKKISITHISKRLLIKSIEYGVPLIGVALLGNIISSSDQYFLLYFLGKKAVGNYALGYRLVDAILNNLLMVILLVMTPELNAVHDKSGEDESKVVLKKMINSAVWIMLPFTLAIIAYAKYIIMFFFPKYTDAVIIMSLVVFASVFNGLSMFTCKALELVKKPKYILYSLIIASLINCGYNAIFIKIYGVTASAHSSIISYIVYNILLVYYSRRYYDLQLDFRYILKTVLATGVTFLLATLLMNTWGITNLMIFIIQFLVAVIVYLVCSVILKLFEPFFN